MNPLRPDNIEKNRPLSSSFWAFFLILVISSLTVFFLRHKPIWYEMEILAGELILILSSFYSYILYKGIDFEDELIPLNTKSCSYQKITDWCSDGDGMNFYFFTNWGGEIMPIIGHIIGFIIDLIVAFIFTLIISFLLWIGLNFLITGVVFLVSSFYYFFMRSNSIIFRHQARCRHRICFALFYGVFYASVYTILMCLVVFFIRSITP
jgi:hypothetical protein